MRAALAIVLLSSAATAGCLDAFLDRVSSDCGAARNPEFATGALPLADAEVLAVRNVRFYTWKLDVTNACPREHVRATAEIIQPLAQVRNECPSPESAKPELYVSSLYTPYAMQPTRASSDDEGREHTFYEVNDAGLAQAYKEDEKASYTVRFQVIYPVTDPEQANQCIRELYLGVKLTTAYKEFAPKE